MVDLIEKMVANLEIVFCSDPMEKKVNAIMNVADEFKSQTDRIVQNNLYKWSGPQIRDYNRRSFLYMEVQNALLTLDNDTNNFLSRGVSASEELYQSILKEFIPKFQVTFDNQEKKDIVEDVLIPHLLMQRFLERIQKA